MFQNLRPTTITFLGMTAMVLSCAIAAWALIWAKPFPGAPHDYQQVTKVIGYLSLALLAIATWLTNGLLGRMIIRLDRHLSAGR